MKTYPLTAIIQREDDMLVAVCPELDIASQGKTLDEAKRNLEEAVKLFLETASETEIQSRLKTDVVVERLEVEVA